MRTLTAALALIIGSSVGAQTVIDQSAEGIPQSALLSATAALAKELADPRSLQLRNLRYAPPLRTVCGEFNARGTGGGYEPFRQFVTTPDVTIIVPPPGEFLHSYHQNEANRLCP